MGKRNKLRKERLSGQLLVEQDGKTQADQQRAEHKDQGEDHRITDIDHEARVI